MSAVVLSIGNCSERKSPFRRSLSLGVSLLIHGAFVCLGLFLLGHGRADVVQKAVAVVFRSPAPVPVAKFEHGGAPTLQKRALRDTKPAVRAVVPKVLQQVEAKPNEPRREARPEAMAELTAPSSMPVSSSAASTMGPTMASDPAAPAGAASLTAASGKVPATSAVGGDGDGLGQGNKSSGVDWGAYTSRVALLIGKQRRYPAAALEMGLEGDVEVLVSVKSDGYLRSAPRISRSSGHASLDGEAMKMVERALPLPPPNGGSEDMTLRVPVRFRLDS